MKKQYLIVAILLLSLTVNAENLFKPYYGKYKISEISCTFNGETQETCLKWKQIEIKDDPISKDYVCILMKSANSTSSDCYTEENIVTDNSQRTSAFRSIKNGAAYEQFIRIHAIERKYTMHLMHSENGLIFTRDDQNHFPDSGQDANGYMQMKLVRLRN